MIEWKTRINIIDLYEAYKDGNLVITEVARQLASRLSKNKYIEDWQLQDIVDNFESFAEEGKENINKYDIILKELYDFADYDHRIWIVS